MRTIRRNFGRLIFTAVGLSLLGAGPAPVHSAPAAPTTYLTFDGNSAVVEVPSSHNFSIGSAGLTVAVWMRPDSLTFSKTDGSLPSQQYVHWLGKGVSGDEEWTFRMYSLTRPGPRQNRISFYVFKASGGRGCGSYFQDPIKAGEWMQVVGVIDRAAATVSIYKDGLLRHTDSYASLDPAPQPGSAPLRIASKELTSYLHGAIGPIMIWDRPLAGSDIRSLFAMHTAPANGLVAHFAMNEGAGATIRDSVGGLEGTIKGARWASDAAPIGNSIGTSGGGC